MSVDPSTPSPPPPGERAAPDWSARARALTPETRLLIDGELCAAAAGRRFVTVNPATGEPLAEVARGEGADIDRAVAAARRAFRDGRWSRLPPRARLSILQRFAALIEAHGDTFALLDTLDMGKPISDMLACDVPQAALTLRFFAEAIDKLEGAVTSTDPAALHYILRQPLGVVGCVTPWNYPLLMAAWKIAPALAAGNTVVLKPAEQSPLSAILLGRLFLEAGGPAGVLNVVPGLGEEAGRALALHNDVDKIGFTGSVEVGKLMLIYAGQSNMKRVLTECGGKTPQIILPDVEDLDRAVAAAVDGIFANQGEVCNAGSRLLVHRSLEPAFVERFCARARATYQPGDPLDPATRMGPLVTREHQARVLRYIEAGQREGARLRLGGGAPAHLPRGAYVEPTLFTAVHNDMTIAREEIFGPVAALMPFDTLDEALAIANDSIYGLAAALWTRDLTQAHTFARDVEAGVVWINCFDQGDMTQPWGGFKQSGAGRDKCLETLLHHTQTKSVWIHLGR